MTDDRLNELSILTGQLLLRHHATVTTAESCTGGWIAKVLTDVPGSSAWFERAFITYSNEAKQQMVGVAETSLQQWGAVSEQVVKEMAAGALKEADADFAIAVSGIAGPDGGSADKPVGTVWFGFATSAGQRVAKRHIFQGDRDAVRRQTVALALQTLHDDFLKNLT